MKYLLDIMKNPRYGLTLRKVIINQYKHAEISKQHSE